METFGDLANMFAGVGVDGLFSSYLGEQKEWLFPALTLEYKSLQKEIKSGWKSKRELDSLPFSFSPCFS